MNHVRVLGDTFRLGSGQQQLKLNGSGIWYAIFNQIVHLAFHRKKKWNVKKITKKL